MRYKSVIRGFKERGHERNKKRRDRTEKHKQMGVKTTWFFPVSFCEQMSFPLPVSLLLFHSSSHPHDCCSSDVKPLTLPNENCPVFLPSPLPPSVSLWRILQLFPLLQTESQRPQHQLVLSRSLCSDVNQTLASASVIIGCNCTVCLIHRLRGFICMVISQISESKNLIPFVSCFVHVKMMKCASPACDHGNMVG